MTVYNGWNPPPPRCWECDELIDPDDYDNPMPTECESCRTS